MARSYHTPDWGHATARSGCATGNKDHLCYDVPGCSGGTQDLDTSNGKDLRSAALLGGKRNVDEKYRQCPAMLLTHARGNYIAFKVERP